MNWISFLFLIIFSTSVMAKSPLNYEAMAKQIAVSLHLQPGERVIIRYDPSYFSELVEPLRREIRSVAAVDLAAIEYIEKQSELEKIPTDSLIRKVQADAHLKAFQQLLDAADVYLVLPTSSERDSYPAEDQALTAWLKKGGTRREIHFHWSSGSMMMDGLPAEHPSDYDQIYADALDISYDQLSSAQDRVIAAFQSGDVRVTTPAGTDLTFQIGMRPFNKQNGDASQERAKGARMLVDREIELPAGVLRVAPLEDSANGTMVIPRVRFGDVVATNLKLKIKNGRITSISAEENNDVAEKSLKEAGDAAMRFREFALGFNPKLVGTQSDVLPYYGYGAGVVRLSLGDNTELGGNITGVFVRWFFFPDATVTVKDQVLVKDGKLLQ